MRNILIFVIISTIIAFIIGGFFLGKKEKPKEQVFCTQEAKQCPDGSWISRQGPKCEFAPCPKPSLSK